MKITVTLTKVQAEALHAHAGERDPGEDLVRTWWGRTLALENYAGKLRSGDATFRPYAPKGLEKEEREHLKKLAESKGIAERSSKGRAPGRNPGNAGSSPARSTPAPKTQVQALKRAARVTTRAHKITLYDSPDVAKAKAKGDPKVLKEAGRDKTGRRIK